MIIETVSQYEPNLSPRRRRAMRARIDADAAALAVAQSERWSEIAEQRRLFDAMGAANSAVRRLGAKQLRR